VPSGTRRLAQRQGGVLTYLHGDPLGSASLATNASGANITDSDTRYYPYGATRPGLAGTGLPTDRRFTGQREEMSLGFYDYAARPYDPALGRFLQADTLVPDPGNPQSLNRYAYTLNNPLRYTDPTGHIAWFASMGIGAAIGAVVGWGVYALTTNSYEGTEALLATTTMAAAGALIGSGVGLGAGAELASSVFIGAGVGAASGGGSEMIINGLTGQDFNSAEYICSVGGGAISGATNALIPGVGLAPTAVRSVVAGGVGTLQYTAEKSFQGNPITASGALFSFGVGATGQFLGESITVGIGGTPSQKAAMTHLRIDDFKPQWPGTSPIYYSYYTDEWSYEQFSRTVRAGGEVFRDTSINTIFDLVEEK